MPDACKRIFQKINIFFTTVLIVSSVVSINVFAAVIIDDSQSDFNNGTFNDTMYSTTRNGVNLVASESVGTYTSQIFDAGNSNTSWINFGWETDDFYGGELPDFNANANGINMSNNSVLLHLNEPSGSSSWQDTSGTNNNASCGSQCPVITTDSVFGNALSFDNNSSAYVITNNFSLKDLNKFSIGMWIKPTSISGTQVLFEESTGNHNTRPRLSFRLENGRVALRGRITDDARRTILLVRSTDRVPINQYTHVAAVFDSVSDIHYVYINGVPTARFTEVEAFSNTDPQRPARIGQGLRGNNSFDGEIDEIALFNDRDLTQSDISNIISIGGGTVEFKIRSCNQSNCSDADFVGPGGSTNPTDNFVSASTLTPNFNLLPSLIPDNRYFQYQFTIRLNGSISTDILSPLIEAVNIENEVNTVTPILQFGIRNSNDTANSNTCDLGTASITGLSSCSYRLKITTNSESGFSVFVHTSGSLSNGVSIIQDALPGSSGSGGSDISNSTAGTERYGVTITPGSITGGLISRTSDFNAGVQNAVNFNQTTNTTILTATGTNNPGNTDTQNSILITHKLNIAGDTPPGFYSQSITYGVAPTF